MRWACPPSSSGRGPVPVCTTSAGHRHRLGVRRGVVRAALLVKLTAVLLAPMVAGVGVWRRQHAAVAGDGRRPPVVPLFVVGFLAAIARDGWLSAEALDTAKDLEQALLTAGMFGLGCGVAFGRLRRLGGRPLALGLASWVVIAVVALRRLVRRIVTG